MAGEIKKGLRLLLLGILVAFSLGYIEPLLVSLTTIIPLINVSLAKAIALAVGIFAGDWILDQFPQTRGRV